MSLTFIGLIGALAGAALAIGAFVVAGNNNGDTKKRDRFIWTGVVTGAIALALAGAGFYSLNENIRQSHTNCLNAGGYIYKQACVDRVPVEIQRL